MVQVPGLAHERHGKIPKRVRFTVSSRLDNTALDVLEHIIEAAYTRDKLAILRKANLKLEKLRVMLRLSYDRKYLAGRSYEYGIRQMHETGKMLGGWIKSVEKR